MIILDEEIPLKANIRFSFRRYWLLWVILLVTITFDFLSTLLFMAHDGINTEKNFIIRWLAYHAGVLPGVFLGKMLQIISAIGFAALSATLARATLLLMLLLNIAAVFNNVL